MRFDRFETDAPVPRRELPPIPPATLELMAKNFDAMAMQLMSMAANATGADARAYIRGAEKFQKLVAGCRAPDS